MIITTKYNKTIGTGSLALFYATEVIKNDM